MLIAAEEFYVKMLGFKDDKSAKSVLAAATGGGARQLVMQSCAAVRACSRA